MRKIREVLRLSFESGLSAGRIAAAIGSARSTVQECLRRCREAGVGWPLPEGLDEAALQARLYQRAVPLARNPAPDFAELHAELKRPGVTRLLLWQEYKAAQPDGWQYSVFCDRYRRWLATQDLVLRQHHQPGDKAFIDYAGHTMPVIDRHSGAVRQAQLFVAVLGASNYTYADATWTQQLPDWLGSHVRALEFWGGSPAAFVPDNLKSGVHKAHRYEPEINPAYQDFAEHYGVAVLPARARKPRDKAKVEVGVQIAERWILARLRNLQFFSLAELNAAIRPLLEQLNHKPFKRRAGCRASLFLEVERPALRPLPQRAYEFATWKKAKVHLDYHLQVEHAYYSVPYALIGQTVDVRLSAHTLEVFHRQKLVATHARVQQRGQFVTHAAHRPERHHAVIELTQERLMQRALAIGPATAEVLAQQVQRRAHPEEALRASLGILRLAQDFNPAQLEAAAVRALQLQTFSYRALHTLIRTPPVPEPTPASPLDHENLRGADYFH
ncbi:MAG TPA: IS21 family transposase [Xanthomonadales bacterium]|nr:IS21 family transposase [Xanthomonadales bacterium]